MLQRDQVLLVLVDVQGKLSDLVIGHELLFNRLELLLRAWRLLDLPIVVTEQSPGKLGPTREFLEPWLEAIPRFAKKTFSCWRHPPFRECLEGVSRRQILLAGIETHVCISQTALHLLAEGYEVYLAADAVSARRACDHDTALQRLVRAGVEPVTVESALYELLEQADHQAFAGITRLVKQYA